MNERMSAVTVFRTPTGLLVPAITTEQMREVDRVAINEVGPNLYQMMENAGRNLASLCVKALRAEALGDAWTQAPIAVGELWLADIGIPREVYRRVGVAPPDGLFALGYRVRLHAIKASDWQLSPVNHVRTKNDPAL